MGMSRRRIGSESFPSWVRTLDAAITEGTQIKARCSVCTSEKPVDLVALREIKGGDFSLINRRTRCRLTEGCKGWARFYYLHAVWRPLWDDPTAERWMLG